MVGDFDNWLVRFPPFYKKKKRRQNKSDKFNYENTIQLEIILHWMAAKPHIETLVCGFYRTSVYQVQIQNTVLSLSIQGNGFFFILR